MSRSKAHVPKRPWKVTSDQGPGKRSFATLAAARRFIQEDNVGSSYFNLIHYEEPTAPTPSEGSPE